MLRHYFRGVFVRVGFAALCLVIIIKSCDALAQSKDQLPTGKQYLVGQLAAAEAKVSDMLDEIAALQKQIETLRATQTKREEPKKP